jgi:hypothetical protein
VANRCQTQTAANLCCGANATAIGKSLYQGILTKQREKLAKFAFVAAVWGCYADREHHYVNAKESPYQRMR